MSCLLFLAILCLSLLGALSTPADRSVHGSEVTAAAGETEIRVSPRSIILRGATETYSILVHGRAAKAPDGGELLPEELLPEFDLTHEARFRSRHPEIALVSERGVVSAVAAGSAAIEVEAAGRSVEVAVEVRDFDRPREFHFENDVLPIMTRFGCNGSGCHAKANGGQNGFQLSVFGFDAAADYDELVADARGRRVSFAAPDLSLLLRKATNQIPHGGGRRFEVDSWAYQTLRGWMRAGVPYGRDDAPTVRGIVVTPGERRLRMKSTQQLRVVATYSDGHEVDVTPLAKYQSNNEGLASVDEFGLVTVGSIPGQVAIMANFHGAVNTFRALIPRAETIDDYPQLVANNFIDELVYAKLRKLNVVPSGPASDADFLRRVFLDVIGTLPTVDETRRFIADKASDKRARLVEALFERPEYATYWALKWADRLRVDRDVLGHKGAYEYYRWIRDSLAENKPLDRFVYEILTAEGPLDEAPQGSLFRVVEKPGARATTVSQVFLGLRIDCAECHHHPYDRWSQTDYYGMVDFFTQLETKKSPRGEFLMAAGNPETKHPRSGKVVYAHALGTSMPSAAPSGDRRLVLADWLTAAKNPWFAHNLTNRVWAHFMGRGLVEPVDDFRATNPPSNAELHDALAAYFVESGFDLRALIRTITASRVYGLSSTPNATNQNDEQNYSRALLKPLEAEVLLDAVCQVTGVPEKFGGVPYGQRAIALWDSQVEHDFLDLFGRPIRKSACECERVSEPNVAQVLHLMNSPLIHNKLVHDGGTVARLEREIRDDAKLVTEVYLSFYNRYPTAEEQEFAAKHLSSHRSRRRQAAVDLAWSLLNSLEFALNH